MKSQNRAALVVLLLLAASAVISITAIALLINGALTVAQYLFGAS